MGGIFFAAVITAAGAYLLGSISFSVLMTKIFTGDDIRGMGSGNAGMTNVLRSVGVVPGILTEAGDFLKGAGALALGTAAFFAEGLSAYAGGCLAAAFVLLGHLFPVFFRFRGGKGVMTTAGILLLLNPYVLLAEAALFVTVFALTRVVSKGSVLCALLLPVFNVFYGLLFDNEIFFSTTFMSLMSALIFFTHRENIRRIRAGTEGKLQVRRKEDKL